MKKMFFIVALLALLPNAAHAGKGGDTGTMNVQVREAAVKSTPNYLGANAGTVTYGTQVNVTEEQGNWYRIEKPAGWIPKSAVTSHNVKVDSGQAVAGKNASHDEVALAGKGFDKIETQYKTEHPELSSSFQSVDRIDNIKVSEAELIRFQKSGKLTPR
jgi:flagellar basal body P-ring protein FlgI